MQILYDNVVWSLYTTFQTNLFIHCKCSILSLNAVFASKNVFCGVLKQKGKLTFRRINIIHVWQIVSSVAQKLNLTDFNISDDDLKYKYRQAMKPFIFLKIFSHDIK